MDCCNYMPYRSSYGFRSDYYDNEYSQAGDYYGQHFYQDYYNSQYYQQHWQQAPHFPDYVYNPKEARIRKAMREANRDRSMGNSPMLPRLGERLPPHSEWTQSQDDPLMMSPMNEMRRMDSSICNYPMPNAESHFIPQIDVYNKMNSTPMVPNYMQPSPLAQLQQQQTEMWHPYQKNVQPRPCGTPFHQPLIQGMQQSPYISQEPVQDSATNLIMDKSQESPSVCIPQPHAEPGEPLVPENNVLPPCSNTPERPKSAQTNQQHYMDTNPVMECMQTTMVDNKQRQSSNDHLQQAAEAAVNRKSFEPAAKSEAAVVTKKTTETIPSKPDDERLNGTVKSCFCPPSNFFSEEYRMDYITKHFSSLPDYSLTTINTSDGLSFPYASLSPKGYKSVETFLEVSANTDEPILISTEYGYIPVLEVDSLN
ncbi:uncharacterized protein LOC123311890 isoform X2 [Coccinella septempunctata]|uniref:uncharacterized protein LOC123311890 isoform X2 n=1 Tax=Coccinella septempunctata TaxID=41139 RepID=UPI001D065A25|nr:uncharacterized protein LOC123311890 isoform X2 [Coccinella septempunctata]